MSFGPCGIAESLDDFRYSPTLILSCHKLLVFRLPLWLFAQPTNGVIT